MGVFKNEANEPNEKSRFHIRIQARCSPISIRTLEKWERGERIPEAPTRAYLTVIANNPKAVIDALHQIS